MFEQFDIRSVFFVPVPNAILEIKCLNVLLKKEDN